MSAPSISGDIVIKHQGDYYRCLLTWRWFHLTIFLLYNGETIPAILNLDLLLGSWYVVWTSSLEISGRCWELQLPVHLLLQQGSSPPSIVCPEAGLVCAVAWECSMYFWLAIIQFTVGCSWAYSSSSNRLCGCPLTLYLYYFIPSLPSCLGLVHAALPLRKLGQV